jgi:hypothetical protein
MWTLLALVNATAHAECPEEPDAAVIEVAPRGDATRFDPLPSRLPSWYDFERDATTVDFETYPDGTPIPPGSALSDEFKSVGVEMGGVWVYDGAFDGASSGEKTTGGGRQVFNFLVPVKAAAIVNTSPDHDIVELYTGQNGTGDCLLRFADQEGEEEDVLVDRLVGGRAAGFDTIGSMVVINASGNLELDDLVFEPQRPVLTVPTLVHGEKATIRVERALPGSSMSLVMSRTGTSEEAICRDTMCLDLEPSVKFFMGVGTVDDGGKVSWTFTVPGALALGDLWMQAVQVDDGGSRASNVDAATVVEP